MTRDCNSAGSALGGKGFFWAGQGKGMQEAAITACGPCTETNCPKDCYPFDIDGNRCPRHGWEPNWYRKGPTHGITGDGETFLAQAPPTPSPPYTSTADPPVGFMVRAYDGRRWRPQGGLLLCAVAALVAAALLLVRSRQRRGKPAAEGGRYGATERNVAA